MIATIGTIIMFSNPNYDKILFRYQNIKQVSNNQGIFSKFLVEMISSLLPYGVIFSQIIILSMIAVLIIYLLLRSDRYVHLQY